MEDSWQAVLEELGVSRRLGQRSGEVDALAALELAVNARKSHKVGLPSEAHRLPWAHIVTVALKDTGKLTFGRSAFSLAFSSRVYHLPFNM